MCNKITISQAQKPMIQRLIQIQKQRLKRQQQKLELNQPTPNPNKGFVNLQLGPLASIPQATRTNERSKSGEELKHKHAPFTDRATLNRKIIFIKTRNKYSTYYLSKFKSNPTQPHPVKHSNENLFLTKNYFCATPPTKTNILGRNNSDYDRTSLQQYLPTCSRIHRIGKKFEGQIANQTNFLNFKRSKSFTSRSLTKRKPTQYMSSKKLRVPTEAHTCVNKGLLSQSMEISPWKYNQ